MNSHDHLGSVSIIDVPDARRACAEYTETVNANNRLAYSLAGLEKPRPDAKPMPVPDRHGEPSVIKHVIYVIKENRTYDQVFGDMKEGNGDPKLLHLRRGRHAEPPQARPRVHAVRQLLLQRRAQRRRAPVGERGVRHRLPREGVRRLHPQLPLRGERPARVRLQRVPLGQRPGTQEDVPQLRRVRQGGAPTGHRPGPTCTRSTRPAPASSRSRRRSNVAALEPYTHPSYPGFVMSIPDVYRAKLFIDELKEFEQKGEFPQPHLPLPAVRPHERHPPRHARRRARWSPTTTWRSGRWSRPSARSKFWKDTCIFVVEDDPQNGFDHVDGHRTVGLVISPYTKREVRRLDLLQPDGHGEDDRADPRTAADEPARPVGHGDAQLLHRTRRPDAVHDGAEHGSRSTR